MRTAVVYLAYESQVTLKHCTFGTDVIRIAEEVCREVQQLR